MRGYLNSEERALMIRLAIVSDELDQIITEMSKSKMVTTDFKKNLRTSKTLVRKAFNNRLESLCEEEVLNFVKKASNVQMYIAPKKEVRKEIEKIKGLREYTTLHDDVLFDIITIGMCNCELCDLNHEEIKECKYRKAFIEADAEPQNTEPNGLCQFKRLRGKSKNGKIINTGIER